MKFSAKLVSFILSTNVLIIGCSSTYYTDFGYYNTVADNNAYDNINFDEKIQKVVKEQFPKNAIKVLTNHFNVLLVGQVYSKEIQVSMVKIVKQQHNVKHVWDYTTVSSKPVLNYNSSLMSEVEDRLKREEQLQLSNMDITAIDGVVYIMGTNIGNLQQLQHAITGIYAIDGVKKVVNLEQKGYLDYVSPF